MPLIVQQYFPSEMYLMRYYKGKECQDLTIQLLPDANLGQSINTNRFLTWFVFLCLMAFVFFSRFCNIILSFLQSILQCPCKMIKSVHSDQNHRSQCLITWSTCFKIRAALALTNIIVMSIYLTSNWFEILNETYFHAETIL